VDGFEVNDRSILLANAHGFVRYFVCEVRLQAGRWAGDRLILLANTYGFVRCFVCEVRLQARLWAGNVILNVDVDVEVLAVGIDTSTTICC
jgi:hypothetical protein